MYIICVHIFSFFNRDIYQIKLPGVIEELLALKVTVLCVTVRSVHVASMEHTLHVMWF